MNNLKAVGDETYQNNIALVRCPEPLCIAILANGTVSTLGGITCKMLDHSKRNLFQVILKSNHLYIMNISLMVRSAI